MNGHAMSALASTRLARARIAAAQVCDPEIPSLSLEDLGILREVALEDDTLVVIIAPTYTGCPATEAIRDDVLAALDAAKVAPFEVRISLAPAWSSDWITAAGRRKLLEAGIAPPACVSGRVGQRGVPIRVVPRGSTARAASADLWADEPGSQPTCPRCGSSQTERLSEFGSTACKSLYRCRACAEPFDYFKPY
jgi:ring-1,2-phenylacetyl-CoA epoxidase subunit PaaD